jgi:hypothetical protein
MLGQDLVGIEVWYFYTLQVGQKRQPVLSHIRYPTEIFLLTDVLKYAIKNASD